MTRAQDAMRRLEETFGAWARARPDIRAALVVGSRARDDHPADDWADLDIIIVATDPRRYLSASDWLEDLGPVWVATRGRTNVADPEWLVVFDGAVDVDFVFIPYRQTKWGLRALSLLSRRPGLMRLLPKGLASQAEERIALSSDAFRRGIRVLVDKDGLAAGMRRLFSRPPSYRPPSRRQFADAVNGFWVMVERTAKKLLRGEVYVVRRWSDSQLREMLLQMVEWHARATRGPDLDTWHDGRFLDEWADPRALQTFADVFARYDRQDSARALLAMMDLFRWLAVETAERLGYPYPADTDAAVTEWVRASLADIAGRPPDTQA
ncbi:MAG TPA: aminoglycoside 6-adenylyltransferase [Dehalococcoidia bacterium]|nr:aminoglycoside 6-adenylyltransferase [Dehalococcoidia bacterium]